MATSGIGLASSSVNYSYVLEVTNVSSCSGYVCMQVTFTCGLVYHISSHHRSVLGGHTIAIQGKGFGDVMSGVVVAMGNRAKCKIDTISDTSIQCTTSSSSVIHSVTNNAYVCGIYSISSLYKHTFIPIYNHKSYTSHFSLSFL